MSKERIFKQIILNFIRKTCKTYKPFKNIYVYNARFKLDHRVHGLWI